MSKHFITILLLISLAFNLAVMCMFAYASIYHRPPFNPPQWDRARHHEGMGFRHSEHGRRWPDTLMENRDEIKQLREAFSQSRKEFMQEMRSDKFDLTKATAAMQKSLLAQEKLEKRLGESLLDMRKKMSTTEAQKFFQERQDRNKRDNMRDRMRFDRSDRPDDNQPQGDKK